MPRETRAEKPAARATEQWRASTESCWKAASAGMLVRCPAEGFVCRRIHLRQRAKKSPAQTRWSARADSPRHLQDLTARKLEQMGYQRKRCPPAPAAREAGKNKQKGKGLKRPGAKKYSWQSSARTRAQVLQVNESSLRGNSILKDMSGEFLSKNSPDSASNFARSAVGSTTPPASGRSG